MLKPWGMLAILTGLNLFNYIDRYVLSSVLEQIKGQFHFDDGAGGWLATAFMLGYFLTCPIFGYLGDRMSRKYLIAGGIFVWSVATVLTGFATDYWHLIVCRVLIGFGEASYATLSPGLLADTFAPNKRNNAYTIFYAAIPIGAAIGIKFGSYMGATYGWQHAFIWAGAPGVLLASILLPFREPKRGEADGAEAVVAKASLKDTLKIFAIRDYALCAWGYVAYTFMMGAFAHWAPSFLTREHGMTQKAAGDFFGIVLFISGIFGTFLGGFAATALQKKFKNSYAMALALSTGLALPFITACLVSHDPFIVKACIAIGVFCLFLSTGPVNTVTIESVPANVRASAMAGQIFLIHAFGDVWSPYIVGKVSAANGDVLTKGLLLTPWALLIATLLWGYLAYAQKVRPAKIMSV